MKKLFTILLTLAFTLTLSACSLTINVPDTDGNQSPKTSQSTESAKNETAQSSQSAQVSDVAQSADNGKDNTTVKTESPTTAGSQNQSSASSQSVEPSSKQLTQNEALDIALNKAGVSKDAIRELEIEFDRDNGVPLYEIEFKSGSIEYKYDIHAETGAVLERDKDFD